MLGADFLANFNLSVNMVTQSLIDNLTEILVRGICSWYQSIGISTTLPVNKFIRAQLQEYVAITQALKHADQIMQHAKHCTEQPLYSTPRGIQNHQERISANVTNANYIHIQEYMFITITHGASTKHYCMEFMCVHVPQ